ncbi:nuclear transport factor 2 family protein [Kitasatospora sp. RB6PN24]|uniref:nuclear transport factor 2 family protein n=1 Tax=Kitasatospora humi TaxID=2893891 RepID=UPI001E49FB6D|nr:nuclear transport factor 2 family protein [Kitasatospora humi]MCC9307848.1 nuclear transport factor 2 family protein [Kitasatospora humi]
MIDQDLRDRLAVVETCTRMCWHTDQREWEQLLGRVFAEKVRVDYTSLNGGEPAELPADALVGAWRDLLGALDATQHLLTNHLVTIEGDAAVVTANFQATHVLAKAADGPMWTLGGRYRFDLVHSESGWRIAGLVMTKVWQTGNLALLASVSR